MSSCTGLDRSAVPPCLRWTPGCHPADKIFAIIHAIGHVPLDGMTTLCRVPHLQYSKDGIIARIVHQCPGLAAVYRACPFLTNGHVETIFAAVVRADPSVHYYRRCLIMPDGAAIALDYELLPPELVSDIVVEQLSFKVPSLLHS